MFSALLITAGLWTYLCVRIFPPRFLKSLYAEQLKKNATESDLRWFNSPLHKVMDFVFTALVALFTVLLTCAFVFNYGEEIRELVVR